MNNIKETIRKNKKKAILIAAIILVFSAGITIYATMGNNQGSDKKEAVMTAKEQAKTEKLEDEMKEKLKAAKTDEEKERIAKEYSEKIEDASNGKIDVKIDKSGKVSVTEQVFSSASNASSKPSSTNKPSSSTSKLNSSVGANKPSSSSSSSSSKPSSSKPAAQEKKKVWVVDKPAWTETVKKPVYAYRETWWINFGNGNIKTYYDKQEWRNAYLGNPDAVQWGNGEDEEYISHYETTYVEHPEEGHWEYR